MSDDDEQLRLTLNNLERALSQVQDKLKGAHVLNGGFDRLMEKVAKIEDNQDKILDEMNSLKTTIYDPDDGLFSRIKSGDDRAGEKAHEIDKTLSEIKLKQESDLKDAEKIEKEIEKIEEISDVVTDLTKWKANVNKVIWAVVIPIVTTFGKIIYDFIATHVQLK